MSAQHPVIDDPDLGTLTRAESTFDDGTVAVHDWYAGRLPDPAGTADLELMIDGPELGDVQARLPRLRAVVADLALIRRAASDAIITQFSDVEPAPHELDEGARDLQLEAIEASGDAIVLHFVDGCGEHFPEGYWPAAHLGADNTVSSVTVES